MNTQSEYPSSFFNCPKCDDDRKIVYLFVSSSGCRCPECNYQHDTPTLSTVGHHIADGKGIPCFGCGSQSIILDDAEYFSECVECGGRWSRKSVIHDMKPGEDRTLWGRLWDAVGELPPP